MWTLELQPCFNMTPTVPPSSPHAFPRIATSSKMACCSTHGVIDQVTAMPVGLLHLGYLTSPFDLLRTSQCWFGHPSTTRSLGLAAWWESHMPSHYPRPAPSFASMFSGPATPVPSRVPSWVKSFWCPPSGTAQSCSCTRPCVSAHHT